MLNRNDKPQEALAKVEAALKLDPDNVDAWRVKVALLRNLGRDKEAIAALEKVVKLSSEEREITAPRNRESPTKRSGKKKD